MLIAAIVSALIAFPVQQDKYPFSRFAKLTFDCHSVYNNKAGQNLLDRAILESHAETFETQSWGLRYCSVEPSAVPQIAAYLIPRLKASKQRLILEHDSLILYPESKEGVYIPPTKKHKRPKA